jgi:ATP-dependent Clp protease ATP-binding subunit ClpC
MKPEQATIQLNLSSRRSRQARFAAVMKKGLALVCKLLVGIFAALAVALFVAGHSAANFCVAAALFTALWVIWYTTALAKLAPRTPETTIDDVLDQTVLARLRAPVSPQIAWQALSGHWQEIFMTNRLLLSPDLIKDTLSDNEADMAAVWQRALALRPAGDPQLHAGTLTTALILSSPQLKEFMTRQKLTEDDVLACHDWLARILASDATPKPYFGGVGRDWAFGFTPNLERFSTNLSLQIQSAKSAPQFAARGGIIDAVVNGLAQTNSIAVVGDAGIGKSSAVFALAQRLLQADAPAKLKDHQIVSLNASLILSQGQQNLERLMLTLFGEAIRAGNMILFLDEAQVFFQEGRGAFDMSHIILPVLQNKRLKLITSFNTTDFQRLKARNPSLASTLMPVMMQEPTASESMKIIQDSSLGIEYRTKRIVSYESIREAYRLSGQYIQDAAYPGKAITLLEQAAAYPDQNVITAKSVQETIEKTLGVKAGGTDTQEAASLLNLEDSIHQRMINQTAAVSAIANALRRSRAGVASTNRPIGTFLFLGPTGVGKTELARSLAATYFGDEKNMIRLDMSEYQQAQDVSRLIDAGAESDSLILQIRKQPFSVLLLDEIEKAHSSVLNLLLQLLDEGQLTDASGRPTSFRDAIVIVTSNAGSADILARVNAGESLEGFEKPLIDQLIATGVFRAELINRFDEVVLFRPLGKEELRQVAQLMLAGVNKTLGNQNISVELTNAAIDHLVDQGYDPQFGARPMRRVIQRTVEDVVAKRILSGQATPGSNITLDIQDIKNT